MKQTEFKIIANGPIHVKGYFTIIGPNGKSYNINDEAWLCRCGASKDKPFCDSSHKIIGVRD